jgi:uncharacterized lipoprotein YddW (UPF0748 family)
MHPSITLSAPLTHSDWMLRSQADIAAGAATYRSSRSTAKWGPEGVQYMLDQCKACGWSTIHWRVFDGGRATYASKLMDPYTGQWDKDNYYDPQDPADRRHAYWTSDPNSDRDAIVASFQHLDYSKFDALAEAVRYGHEIGLKINAWMSINEDDHGWGLTSRFTRANPQSRWRKRDGTFYHSQQSFAFDAVQLYKLALVREILENYAVDGIFMDWMRTGDTRDNPQSDSDGVADFGYEQPLVDSFQKQYGIDPHNLPNGDERWVAWRAQPQTRYMRSVRQLMKSLKPDLPLIVMGQNPWSFRGLGDKIDGNLRGLLLDMETWAKEGLIDAAVAAGYYRDGGDAEKAYRWLRSLLDPKVDVWTYAWVPDTVATFQNDLAIAHRVHADHMLLWEADYIDARDNKTELQSAMRMAVTA